jgi:hypothetical protein
VGRERMLAKQTKRLPLSRSLLMLKHLATILMLTRKHSGPQQRPEPTSIYTRPCSHQIIFKANSLLQSNYRAVGTIRPTTRES